MPKGIIHTRLQGEMLRILKLIHETQLETALSVSAKQRGA